MNDESCADFLDRIVYLLDNELDAGEIREVKLHLDECAPCLERYDVQRTIKTIVARYGGSVAWSAQLLGRLPWLAFFFLRARRLLPVLPMMTSWKSASTAHPPRGGVSA
jgi:mycothiol system anti-sigma-R factor